MEPVTFVLSAAALTGLAGFTAYIVKDYVQNLKDQVRDANKRTETANAQGRENVKAIGELSKLVENLVAKLNRN